VGGGDGYNKFLRFVKLKVLIVQQNVPPLLSEMGLSLLLTMQHHYNIYFKYKLNNFTIFRKCLNLNL